MKNRKSGRRLLILLVVLTLLIGAAAGGTVAWLMTSTEPLVNTFVSGDLMPPHIVDLNDWQVPDWPTTPAGEDRQAQDLLAMADTLFAHPQVEAFTNWDFTDGAWLGAPAGLVRKDGSRKPSWEALYQRIHQDWHTRVTLRTDERGQCRLEGFRGDYVLRCGGKEAAYTLRRDLPEAEITFRA